MNDFAYEVERCFVQIVTALTKEKRLKISDFAQMVWPERTPTAGTARWNVIKGKSTLTGAPQKLLFSDAVRIAKALDMELAVLILKATDQATTEWNNKEKERLSELAKGRRRTKAAKSA
jgi:hypothetical protein